MEIQPPETTVSCIPPLLWRTNRCECPDGGILIGVVDSRGICVPPPPPNCELVISYPPNAPDQVTIQSTCNDASVELALALLVAKLLASRP